MPVKPKKTIARKGVKTKKATSASKQKVVNKNNKNAKKVAVKASKTAKMIKAKTPKKNASIKKQTKVKAKSIAPKKVLASKRGKGKSIRKSVPIKKTVSNQKKPTGKITAVKLQKPTKPAKAKKVNVKLINNKESLQAVSADEQILPYQEKIGEDYMNEKQQEHFRKILLQRKQQILEEMNRTMHHLQDEAANFPDPNDRATQEEEFSLELRARDRERKFIKNIEDAVQKLDEGEYGYCDACGVEIGIRRLEARPTATLCIDCKTLDEMREKHIGG